MPGGYVHGHPFDNTRPPLPVPGVYRPTVNPYGGFPQDLQSVPRPLCHPADPRGSMKQQLLTQPQQAMPGLSPYMQAPPMPVGFGQYDMFPGQMHPAWPHPHAQRLHHLDDLTMLSERHHKQKKSRRKQHRSPIGTPISDLERHLGAALQQTDPFALANMRRLSIEQASQVQPEVLSQRIASSQPHTPISQQSIVQRDSDVGLASAASRRDSMVGPTNMTSRRDSTAGPTIAASRQDSTTGPAVVASQQDSTTGPAIAAPRRDSTTGPAIAASRRDSDVGLVTAASRRDNDAVSVTVATPLSKPASTSSPVPVHTEAPTPDSAQPAKERTPASSRISKEEAQERFIAEEQLGEMSSLATVVYANAQLRKVKTLSSKHML